MGYTKIIQSGDYIEVYRYQKNRLENGLRQKRKSSTQRKRRSRQDYRGDSIANQRTAANIKRAKSGFFRLVSANLQGSENPAFVTLTVTKECDVDIAYYYLKQFVQRLRKIKGVGIRYIATPEWQPVSGFIHFHCLFWGLAEEDQDRKDFDRDRRNYQRQWLRGYCDVRFAKNRELAIAGYMAKYMAKASEDKRLRNIRAYSSSRNCKRPYSAGSNSLDNHLDLVLGEEGVDIDVVRNAKYDTLWLGRCDYEQYKRR